MKFIGVLMLLTGLALTLLLRFGLVESLHADLNLSGILPAPLPPVHWAPAVGGILVVFGVALYTIAERKKRGTAAKPMRTGRKKNTSKNFFTKPENVIYADNQGVSITHLSLRVGKSIYPLQDISRYGISTITPNRVPAILMIGLGIFIATLSRLNVVQFYLYDLMAVTVHGYNVDLVEGFGVVLFILGLLALILVPVRYAVVLVIGTGEIMPVASRKKKYVEKIAGAIGNGLRSLHTVSVKEHEMSVN